MGEVESISPKDIPSFSIKLLTNEIIKIQISKTTFYEVLRNIGDIVRDRVKEPDINKVEREIGKKEESNDKGWWDAKYKLIKYVQPGLLICIQGIYSESESCKLYSARRIVLMHSEPNRYGWEETHWWIQQINTLFEQWLDVLFQTRREFTENDFAEFYRTNLNLLGGTTMNSIQESATLSRFLYGLSSSYHMTGNERALSAARACAKYIVNGYSSSSHDGQYVFWKFGRTKDENSTKEIISSMNADDLGTFALYEQIYVLSGLTQYYRVTQDNLILNYIVKTIAAFERFYLDDLKNGDPNDTCYKGYGGYFSHIDPVTMRPDSAFLNLTGNSMKKNWNSIGDHIPAYLINLILSIDPLPDSKNENYKSLKQLLELCRKILNDCVENIIKYFVPEKGTLFVNERFNNDWTPDHSWGWQQNRGIVGHNLKISWNLTRCSHYYLRLADEAKLTGDLDEAKKLIELAKKCCDFARKLGHNMKKAGVDLIRGGIFDALERFPMNEMPIDFAWSTTKDFWQQEQAILAYYIMHGIGKNEGEKKDFLRLARFCSAFWSLFFVDQDSRKIYFRTTESGEPVIEGQYRVQAGHAIAGYHSFELSYLVHLYIKTYVERGKGHHDSFVLHYRPIRSKNKFLNVLPDFFRPDNLKVIGYSVNGIYVNIKGPNQKKFQIDISKMLDNSVIVVEYLPTGRKDVQTEEEIKASRNKAESIDISF